MKNKEFNGKNLAYILKNIVDMNRISVLHSIKRKIEIDERKKAIFTQMYAHMAGEQLRNSFIKWRRRHSMRVLTERIENNGSPAIKVLEINQKITAMESFINQEGYSAEGVRNIVSENVKNNEDLLCTVISRWMNYRSIGHSLSDMLALWKKYAISRKLINATLAYINSVANRKSSRQGMLLNALNRWRTFAFKPREMLMKLPKSELILQVVRNDKAIEARNNELRIVRQKEESFKKSHIILSGKSVISKGQAVKFLLHLHENGLRSGNNLM